MIQLLAVAMTMAPAKDDLDATVAVQPTPPESWRRCGVNRPLPAGQAGRLRAGSLTVPGLSLFNALQRDFRASARQGVGGYARI
jgi:hypothetical protein